MRGALWFVVLWLAVDALLLRYVWPWICRRWDREHPYVGRDW